LYTEYLRKDEASKAKFKEAFSPEGWAHFLENEKIANEIHRRNAHKLNSPVNLNILPILSFK
jgi:uncharacterized pyridoxal phosphate-containing UPF0001 family protein